jgi:class 3 adenylate cyclase/DNA-binding SARP family transcriptional activator
VFPPPCARPARAGLREYQAARRTRRKNRSENVRPPRNNEGVVAGITKDAPAGQAVRVRLLGQLVITAGDRAAGPWPRPSARRLCALLLVSPGHRVSRDLACEELFPRLEPRAAARSLSKALSMARTALAELGEPGTALLGADLTHLRLAPGIEVDADDLAAALHAGLAMPPSQARDDALAAALEDDTELLPGEPYADWADRARDRLNGLRQEARLVLARDRAKGAGRSGPDDVAAAWLACLDHDPACEEAAGALICLSLAHGRPEQAARVFERCRAALEQLGLRISPSLERIYASAIAAPAAQAVPPAAPAFRVPPSPAASPASPVRLPAAQAGSPREERRPVTVLFAEVAAPAGLAGTLGLEALRDLVGGSLATVIAEVESLGGTVTSVSGRGLQAMFGAPEAHEDDPERAVRAAYRAISAAAANVGWDSTSPLLADAPTAGLPAVGAPAAGPPAAGQARRLGLRIGVESGPALVGPIGGGARVEYAALGDVVSAAAALQAAARPGSVLVGPATRAATAHLFSWGTREGVTFTPGARPLIASYLDGPLATAVERRPRLGGRAPMVGRQAELRLLDTALRAAVVGRGQFVLLTGEPGIGKTRLVQESRKRFIAWVGAGSGRCPLWLEGRAVSYASATPYALYRQLLASWLGVALDQPAAALRLALSDALTRLMGNTNLLTPLAHLMGLPGSHAEARGRIAPEELHRQVFAAMRALVSRFVAVGPAVLVLEDLHWADPTSLRLTAELAELAEGRSLLLLATSRPGTGAAHAAGLAGAALPGPSAREIRLRPLAAVAARALATSLLGQVSDANVLSAVLANADGNPLFLEERLAEMLETGVLVREQGVWRLRTPADPAQLQVLPGLLERLVRSRVDRLSQPAADAIRAAAVLGTEFTADVLAATLGETPAALVPVLDELRASDLVHPEPHASRGPVFRFRHALIQEAIYLALLRAERCDLHARAARALEAAASGRLPEVAAILGRHYATAENADRALHYLELAGDHATDAFANDEAIASFREALAVTERAGDEMAEATVRLHAKLANVLWRTARHDEARAAFHAALRLANAGPRSLDPVLRAHLHTRLGRLEMTEARFAEAAAAFDAAEVLLGADAGRAGATDDAATGQWLELMIDGRASLHLWCFEPDLALAALEQARPVLEAYGTPARKTAFYRFWTMQKLQRNRLRVDEEDMANLRAAVAAAEHPGEDSDKDVGYATDFLGWALWLRGDLAAAAEELTKALTLAERIGETHLRDLALSTLTLTAMRRHDTQAVRALLPRAFEAAREAGAKFDDRIAVNMSVAAWLAWQDSRPDEVLRLAAEIESLNLTNVDSGAMHRWIYLFPLLALRLAAGATAEAVAAARRIIDPSQLLLPDDLTAALADACESWDQGDPAHTAQRLTKALALARTHDYF